MTAGLLSDKVALVTGAARGIGRAIAMAFAEHGAHVAVADLLLDGGQAVTREIDDAGGPRAIALHLDVPDPESVRLAVAAVVVEFGRLDILVNNAGIHRGHLIVDFPLDDWEAVFAINVRGALLCSQAAAKQMITQGEGGCILNMSSASGKKPDQKGAAYCASKSAIIGLTRVLALELGQYGIRANVVLPGATDTQMLREVVDRVPGLMDELVTRSLLNRIATPRDQANAFVFLASDLASHITGEQLVVSGGEFMET
ncbi:MAG: SDR family oxidoreductase [Anaerolineales bacterium]|jgi:NAD(P)-dependent dehydrogenase (short-subunit alcohol dehydrogenase family)|nr:SDR family oxidoreductase [Anaerolineales bacterium]